MFDEKIHPATPGRGWIFSLMCRMPARRAAQPKFVNRKLTASVFSDHNYPHLIKNGGIIIFNGARPQALSAPCLSGLAAIIKKFCSALSENQNYSIDANPRVI